MKQATHVALPADRAAPFRRLFLRIVGRCNGCVDTACRRCGVSRTTIDKLLNESHVTAHTGRRVLDTWRAVK